MSEIIQAMKDAVAAIREQSEENDAIRRKIDEITKSLSPKPKQPRSTRKMLRIDLNGYSNTVEREVKGTFGSFFITIRRPSIAERISIRGMSYENSFQRMFEIELSLLVGWKGLSDKEGNEIPFNELTKGGVLGIQPIMDAVLGTIHDYLNEPNGILSEDAEKN